MRSSFAFVSLVSVASVVSAANFVVKVGDNSMLAFTPSTLAAAVGDTITFEFHPKNHTVTQSSFADPCTRKSDGITSGFNPVDASATTFPQYNLTVNGTDPIWIYCAQKNPVSHCAAGMVFAINPPTNGTNTFAAFQAAAKASGGASSAASGTAGYPGASTTGASASSTGTGAAASTATTPAKGNAAMKVSGGAAGALTAMALLVGLAF